MSEPLVSIIIPAYNAEQYLQAAIESALGQSYPNKEIIVVSDGSTDRTVEIANGFGLPVRCIEKENGGVSSARNAGIEGAKGDYVAFLDADDIWRPAKLERQLRKLVGSDDDVSHTAFSVVDEGLVEIEVTSCGSVPVKTEDFFLLGNIVGTPSTVVAKRTLFEEIGGFDQNLSYCADWEMWMRLSTVSSFAYVEEPLVLYRQHEENMSNNAALLESDSMKMFEIAFESEILPEDILQLKRKALAKNYMVLAGTYFHAAQYSDFLRCAFRSVSSDPSQLSYLLSFPGRVLSRK